MSILNRVYYTIFSSMDKAPDYFKNDIVLPEALIASIFAKMCRTASGDNA